jgi:thiol-disulfide isomerase/thioredoxin
VSSAVWQAAVVLLAVTVAVEGLLLVAVMRQVGNLLIMVQPGEPRHIAGGPNEGAELHFAGFRYRPTVVLFVAPNCAPCEELTPALETFRANNMDVELVAIVANGSDEERAEHAARLGAFARADAPDMYHEWNIPGTPYGVAIDSDARARYSGVVNTLDQLEALAIAASSSRQDGLIEAAFDEDPLPSVAEEREEVIAS